LSLGKTTSAVPTTRLPACPSVSRLSRAAHPDEIAGAAEGWKQPLAEARQQDECGIKIG
jgi:hypothetical protein